MAQLVKNPPANIGDTRDAGSIPGSGRSPGVGNGNPLHYYCLQNPMDKGAWQTTVHGVTKELDMTEHTHTHTHTYILILKLGCPFFDAELFVCLLIYFGCATWHTQS